jgi:hypothetical protein
VLADLDRTHPGRCRLVPHDDADFPAFLHDPADGMAIGIRMIVGDEPWASVLGMTEQIQEAAFELVWSPWPECPDHPNGHPLEPDVREGAVVWMCARGGRVVSRVGELGQPSAAS